jgi:hypothetical protein
LKAAPGLFFPVNQGILVIMPLNGVSIAGGGALLKEHEAALAQDIMAGLDAENPAEAGIIRQRFECLKTFEAAIALFPPIREPQTLLGCVRDDRQFVQALVGLAPSTRLLHIPARIQAIRSFLVTKFHAFSLLAKLVPRESDQNRQIYKVLFSVMFTIMAEDVYFSCLSEPSFPLDVKIRIANDLISLWDTGSELVIAQHFHALEALWIARNDSPPSFGTLDGTSEIFRISINLENDWHDFLIHHFIDEETVWALDEFIFGLSYEELVSVRSRLKRFGINAVDAAEIRSYLGSEPAYSMAKDRDPRVLYNFYVDRKEAALLRKRLGAPGPYKTLEEIYLKYRINFWM